jgi:glutaminyl-peptide cyclotransferase
MVLKMKCIRLIFSVCVTSLVLAACKGKKDEKPVETTPLLNYKVKTTWPHDTDAFTEGLVIHNGVLYEGTGQEGKSWIGVINIQTGVPDKKIILEGNYFGEGITILNNKIYQLTYTTHKGFVYDLKTFKRIREFEVAAKEGWGLTHDGVNLIMSDGTDKLTYLDTTTMKAVKTINITDENGVVSKINELEYVNGFIFANQWQTNYILKIDPRSAKVVARMDLTSLAQNAGLRHASADVLNGIAYHSGTKLFIVTGKNWPSYYVLQLNQQ